MRRLTALIAACSISVILGVAMHAMQSRSNTAASQQTTRADTSVDASPDVATKVIADDGSRVKLVQATADGLRDVTITWTRGAAPRPSADDTEVTIADGRLFVVQHRSISLEPSRIGYRISFDFVIPPDNIPVSPVAARHQPDDSLLAAALRTISEALSATVMAADGDGFSGSFTDVHTQLRGQSGQRRDIRFEARRAMEESGRAAGGYCMDFEVRQAKDWVRRIREVNQRMSELGEGRVPQSELESNPAYREAQEAHQSLMAEDRAARSRIAKDVAANRTAERQTSRRSGHAGMEGASAAIEKMMIDAETRAFKERLAALRRCHQNPTNPLAQKAKNEDPAFKKVEDALDAIEMEVNGVSQMREAASAVNAAAGAGLGTMGALMTGIVGEIEDGMLKQSIEEALASIEKCLVKCDPCKSNAPQENTTRNDAAGPTQNFTPGVAGGSDQNYTPGPGQTHTPGPSRPQQQPTDNRNRTPPAPAAVCKPPMHADVTFHAYSAQSGCQPNFPCGTHVVDTAWAGGVDFRYVPDDRGWEGRGTIGYQMYDDVRINGIAICPAGETSTTVATGRPSLVIRVQPTIDQSVTGGNDTSGMPSDTTVVEVIAGSEPDDRLSWETQAQSCGQEKSSSGGYNGPGTECHFYITDFPVAGVYTMDIANGKCRLSIY